MKQCKICLIQHLAFEGSKKFAKKDEKRLFELIKQYENSEDSQLKQLASQVADGYAKQIIDTLYEELVNLSPIYLKILMPLLTIVMGQKICSACLIKMIKPKVLTL